LVLIKMKPVILFIFTFVLCVFGVEFKRDPKIFTPPVLPCANKVIYNRIYFDESGNKITAPGYQAMYGRNLASYLEVPAEKRTGTLLFRADIHDKSNPQTGASIILQAMGGQEVCSFDEFLDLSHPRYFDISPVYEILTEEFEYLSENEHDSFNGKECHSYTSGSETIFVDKNNYIIGYNASSDKQLFEITSYEMNVSAKEFTAPKSYAGCSDNVPAVYDKPAQEPGCYMKPVDDSSVRMSISALALVISCILYFI